MGQAKDRGTEEQRAANPKPKPEPRKLTEEEREELRKSLNQMFSSIKKSLFSPCKPRKIKKPFNKQKVRRD